MVYFFLASVLFSIENKILAHFDQFRLFCCEFTNFLVYFLQTSIMWWCTRMDKYQEWTRVTESAQSSKGASSIVDDFIDIKDPKHSCFVTKIYDYALIDCFWWSAGFIDSAASYATLDSTEKTAHKLFFKRIWLYCIVDNVWYYGIKDRLEMIRKGCILWQQISLLLLALSWNTNEYPSTSKGSVQIIKMEI